jgi:hypothetical protein
MEGLVGRAELLSIIPMRTTLPSSVVGPWLTPSVLGEQCELALALSKLRLYPLTLRDVVGDFRGACEAASDTSHGLERARLIAGMARVARNVNLAEELAQDALVVALSEWPRLRAQRARTSMACIARGRRTSISGVGAPAYDPLPTLEPTSREACF